MTGVASAVKVPIWCIATINSLVLQAPRAATIQRRRLFERIGMSNYAAYNYDLMCLDAGPDAVYKMVVDNLKKGESLSHFQV